MQKILSIVGPTATGKTDFSLQLIKLIPELSGLDILSADSRQVYKNMEIGTGADVPAEFTLQQSSAETGINYPLFENQHIRIHGISIISPIDEWSIAHFSELAKSVFENAEKNHSLPIVVGGTGLYHQHVFSHDDDLYVKPDLELRQQAEQSTLAELQEWLKKVHPEKFASMNHSDQQNPRRLVRAIELSQPREKNAQLPSLSKTQTYDRFTLGLIDSLPHITQKIEERIENRLQHGMIEEVTFLMSHYTPEQWKLPAFSATGYKEVRDYLLEKLSYEEMKSLWLRREVQYAKRQLTWWKKYGEVNWIDISEPGWQEQAVQKIKTWLFSL